MADRRQIKVQVCPKGIPVSSIGGTMDKMNIDESVSKANRITMEVLEETAKSKKINTKVIAESLGVDRSEVREWFSSTMPYEAFLQICKILKTPAGKVFDETKERLKDERKSSKRLGMKTKSTAAEGSEEPAGNEDEPTNDITAEPDVDMSSPDAPPFDLISSDAAGLSGVDGMILDWANIKRDSMQKHKKEMTEDQYRRRIKSFPKPVKKSDSEIELSFNSYKIQQGFVNMGLLNDLENVAKKYDVKISIGKTE